MGLEEDEKICVLSANASTSNKSNDSKVKKIDQLL